MKKQNFLLLLAALLILAAGQPAKAFYPDAFLKDFWNTGIESIAAFGTNIYEAQTFTATGSYPAGLIRLMLSKAPGSTPNLIFFGLYPVDIFGKPLYTEVPFCIGEILANDFSESLIYGTWYEIPCSPIVNIEKGKMYSLVLSGQSSNETYFWIDMDTGYTGGKAYYSDDYGASWYEFPGSGAFEIYAVPEITTELITSNSTTSFYLDKKISYGEIFIIFFLTIFVLMFIADFIYRFIYKIKVNFRH
jgi:hypothetical protein